MHQSNITSEEIIVSKLTDILEQINKNNLSIKDTEWLLLAISYNNTIVNIPNENVDNILYQIYQTIASNGITISENTSSNKALQILAEYTQFLIKDKTYHEPVNRAAFF